MTNIQPKDQTDPEDELFKLARTDRNAFGELFDHFHPPLKMLGLYLEPTHMREEYDSFVNISDWATRKRIVLDPKTKRATVFNLKNLPNEMKNEMKNGMQEGNWFEGTRQMLRAATTDPNAMVILLGEKQLDGRIVVGVRFEISGSPTTLWADPSTQLSQSNNFWLVCRQLID